MATSKSIAALVGPTLVAVAGAILLNLGPWPTLVDIGLHDPPLVFVAGFPLFVAGLAIVRAHNRWGGGWPVVVTLVGWLALIGGLSRILFLTRGASLIVRADKTPGFLPVVAIVILAIGAFLSFKGYSRE
jgi:hypothetical protein